MSKKNIFVKEAKVALGPNLVAHRMETEIWISLTAGKFKRSLECKIGHLYGGPREDSAA